MQNRCNLDCLYCYNYWKTDKNNLTPKFSFIDSIKTLKKAYKNHFVSNLIFTGGEPTLESRLPELVLFARMKGSNVTIITNGNWNNHDTIDNLIELGVRNWELPLHSNDSFIHDSMTRINGSHSNVLKSIEYLKNKGITPIIDIVLSKMNYDSFLSTLNLLKSLNIDKIMLTRFNIGGEGIANIDKLLLSQSELLNVLLSADKFALNNKMNITSNVCIPFCIINPNEFKHLNIISCSASTQNMPITLDSLGNVRICNHSPIIAGNIFHNSFQEIFNSDYIKSWKTIKPHFCQNCNVYDYCNGGCRAASEQLGLDLNHPDPIIKRLINKVV